MKIKVMMPNLSTLDYPVEKAVLLKWFKQEGDMVKKGEPLFEVFTEKVTVEVEAPESGTLRKILASEGSEVRVGEVIATIE